MKYVITGGAGHTSKPIALSLLQAGQQVTVIGRNASHLEELVENGAKVAIGSVEDLDFLKKTFAGADAVYTLIPPNLGVPDWKESIHQIGKNYADAIRANKVKYVVNLSSIGGHMAEGAGQVSGLHRAEEELNELTDVNILHLRPGYFYENLYGNLGMIKNSNIIGSNYGPDLNMVLSAPLDIAAVAAEELLLLNFKGHTVRHIASDERPAKEIAKILGHAIGKPDLPWVEFTDEQSTTGMIQAGFPQEIAKNYTEMGSALRSGKMSEEYWKHHPDSLGKTKLEDFAKSFASAYNAN
jgi:uncharacterized protein YbjT (DUF2867 family)